MYISEHHRKIAYIKWHKGFKCRNPKCKGNRAYVLPDLAHKCSVCKRKESVTAHTAFHGLGIDIDKAMGMLESIVLQWHDFEGNRFEDEFEVSKQGENARLSVRDLAKRFSTDPKKVWRFLNSIMDWLPKSFYKKTEFGEPYDDWFIGIDKKSRLRYLALYNFLFDSNEFRPEYILEILVNKKGSTDDDFWDDYYL